MAMQYRIIYLLPVLLLTAACGLHRAFIPAGSSDIAGDLVSGKCALLVVTTDRYVDEQHVRDAQTARIQGFPFFRINRFLATFRDRLDTAEAASTWLQMLRRLDQRARTMEINNLTLEQPDYQTLGISDRDELLARLDSCGEYAVQSLPDNSGTLDNLIAHATVPDRYSNLLRVAGLYPLSRLVVAARIKRLHREILATFQDGESTTDTADAGVIYGPEAGSNTSRSDIAGIISAAVDNNLGIPVLSKSGLEILFRHYAPLWHIEQIDNNDMPGAMYWHAAGQLAVAVNQPVVYTHLSYTWFDNRVLPQLNYIIWFPARPAGGPMDLLSGHLDGITWRVTLDRDGSVVMYDAIHNCGCYHMFFPVSGLQLRDPAAGDEEPILVPAVVPDAGAGRVMIQLAAGTHYIAAVYIPDVLQVDREYEFVAYDTLRSLPLPGTGNSSMFTEHGVVPGTGRKEQWLLWPMGVVAPGAMKQWGHHAIAFIGRRHFDEPYLIGKNFSAD
jgi:hypothetical protein